MSDLRFIGDLSDRGPSHVRVSRLRQLLVAPGLILLCLVAPPLFLGARLLSPAIADQVVRWFHRNVCRCFNLSVAVSGTPSPARPTLFLANHASYMDVFVLGSLVPGYFVAKADVAGWPVLGKLAAIQNTLFIERDPRRTAEQIQVLKDRLAENSNLFIFPEGTSSDGVRVLDFRASLFAAAVDPQLPVTVQPVTIAYQQYDGEPMTPADRDYYAWYLPMTFLPHFMNGLGLKRATVHVRFHPPVAVDEEPVLRDRKVLALATQQAVSQGLACLLPVAVRESAAVDQPVS